MTNFLQKSVDLIPWSMRDRIRKIPFVAGLQRMIFKTFLTGAEFDYQITAGPAKGLNYPISLPDDKLIWTGTWEIDFSVQLEKAVADGAVCYDIGGHRGFLAGVMLMSGASQVHCFEPNPENADQVRKVIALNSDRDMQIHQMALADEDGEAEFVVMGESSMGKLGTSSFQKDEKGVTSFKVIVRSLDSLVAETGMRPPGLMKIDVEGAEVAVLRGAEATIKEHHPLLFIEFHSGDLMQQCADFLQLLGYSVEPVEHASLADIKEADVGHIVANWSVS